ncbi:hypothetical protein E5225_12830 [Cellulomonas shaoxiangyii]|uniref:Uncharacterized protein n=2 Tax=Cellulomonas shaoxiangyii TaxID=2566013 RepID=A0A4P7SMA2_9CELL|nr:hypothetical protein [Cellulomonas shaoxiangyii]QCB95400.1 hypothetical protein E5225_12830 [Cellulomonas shaoxiangyii]TGY84545.1 hypothetical protein E5226_10915 [Cellulomonas shaoxiangyii]
MGAPDEHDPASHGRQPLEGVDATDLHAAVDALSAALHAYVETAVGVRAEFGAREADEDPRVLALEARVGGLNAGLYDLLHSRLGLHADLTGMTWDDRPDPAAEPGERDTFHLGFVVELPGGVTDLTLESVLDVVDDGGAQITQTLVDRGFVVGEWGAGRGAPVLLDDDDEEDDE